LLKVLPWRADASGIHFSGSPWVGGRTINIYLPVIMHVNIYLRACGKHPEAGAREVETMCSNCSGDDPEPESFALFDVSSPTSGQRFADAIPEKRKRYRTGRFFMKYARTALTLTIQAIRGGKSNGRIIGSVDRRSFVNLNSGSFSGEYVANSRNTQNAEEPIEIRVSSDAIIEVFANSGVYKNARNACGLSEREWLSAWKESYAERNNLRRALGAFRMTRRLKYFMACSVFVTVVALAVWCVVR
jgi:hypothetical protein